MKSYLIISFIIIYHLNVFSQTFSEKLYFTYDNYENNNYKNAIKYVDEIESFLIYEKDYLECLDLYDVASRSYSELNNLSKSEEFLIKRITLLDNIYELKKTLNVDSIKITTQLGLSIIYQRMNEVDKIHNIYDDIIKNTVNKEGFYKKIYQLVLLAKNELFSINEQHESCIKLLENELSLIDSKKPTNKELVQIINFHLGNSFLELANFEIAEKYLRSANKYFYKKKNDDQHIYILSLTALGSLKRRIGEIDSALIFYDNALNYDSNALKKEPLLYANICQNKANCLSDLDQIRDREELYIKTIKLREIGYGSTHAEYAKALSNMGRLLAEIGQYENALSYLLTSDTILIKNYGFTHLLLAGNKETLFDIYRDLGNLKNAEEEINSCLEIHKANNYFDKLGYSRALSARSDFFSSLRYYKKAIVDLENAIALLKTVYKENHEYVFGEVEKLASIYAKMGNISKAKKTLLPYTLDDTLSITYAYNSFYNSNLFSGDLSFSNGEINNSLEEYKKSFNVLEKQGYLNSEPASTLFLKMGILQIQNSRFKDAIKNLNQAIDINKNLFKNDNTKLADLYKYLSISFQKMGLIDSADVYIKKAFQIQSKIYGFNHPATSDLLKEISLLELQKGNFISADSIFSNHIEIEENNFIKNYLILNETGMLEYKSKLDRNVKEFLSSYASLSPDNYFNISSYTTWQNISSINYSFASRISKLVNDRNDTSISNQYTSIKYNMTLRHKWIQMTAKNRIEMNYNIDSLDKHIASQERKFYDHLNSDLLPSHLINSASVLDKLDSVSAFINISLVDSKSNRYLFAIYNKLISKTPILINFIIDSTLIGNITIQKINELATKKEYLWPDLSIHLNGIQRIYISTDGIYSRFNIGALGNEQNKYLDDEFDISYVNNIRSIINQSINQNYTKQSTGILFGFPNYNNDLQIDTSISINTTSRNINAINFKYAEQKELLFTKIETTKIHTLLLKNQWNSTLYIENEATEENIKKMESPRVLHIATHGFFKDVITEYSFENKSGNINIFEKSPLMNTGLLFAGANITLRGDSIIREEDGILTAYEASFLNLRNTELVILSACQTANGESISNEGVYGFRKTLVDAGAKNVILSLWDVSDRVTQEFMILFYEFWLSNNSIRDAFKKAQNKIKKKYSKPYYWASFILIGEG